MTFCTAITCMDGRIQMPVNEYLRKRFGSDYVDTITEPGPNAILAGESEIGSIDSIMHCLLVSVKHHKSVGIAVVGHHDCAGNPAPREEQNRQTMAAVRYLEKQFPGVPVIGLWVGRAWEVQEI